MKNNKIIALDIDGVCADLLSVWLNWYNYEWDDSLEVKDITNTPSVERELMLLKVTVRI